MVLFKFINVRVLNFNFAIGNECPNASGQLFVPVMWGCPYTQEPCIHRPLCPLRPVCLPPSSPQSHRLLAAGLSVAVAVAARPGGYTAVHTVLTVNSASLFMMSVGWMLRSYMGFSNVARTFVFS